MRSEEPRAERAETLERALPLPDRSALSCLTKWLHVRKKSRVKCSEAKLCSRQAGLHGVSDRRSVRIPSSVTP